MLRDVLTSLEGVETWPCDEINYIWRHGNVRYPNDEFPAELAGPSVIRYIRKRFDRLAQRRNAHTVIEKTCANSLRVAFVDRIVPEARYVFIYRNGLDVVASAAKRWKAPLDIGYLAKKARYVPVTDLPYYAARYAANRLHKVFSSDSRLAVWGPLPAGMEDWAGHQDLMEMCALQWHKCVEVSRRDLSQLEPGRVHTVRYEDFVAQPASNVSELVSFLGLKADRAIAEKITRSVSPKSVGLGEARLDDSQKRRIGEIIETTMHELGY